METSIEQNDPRLCQFYAVGLCTEGLATCVLLMLGRTSNEDIKAINSMTPAEAREKALLLWNAADKADRAMDAVVQARKGGS